MGTYDKREIQGIFQEIEVQKQEMTRLEKQQALLVQVE